MLRAPHVRAFTKEQNRLVSYNTTTVNVAYPMPMSTPQPIDPIPTQPIDPIPPKSIESTPQPMFGVQTRDIVLEQNTKTEKILRMLIEAYRNNPLHIKDFIILSDVTLANLIQELTDADEVRLQVSCDIRCCGNAAKSQFLDGIVVKKQDRISDFKIGYNEEYNFLTGYGVSCDFIIKDPASVETPQVQYV